MIRNKICDALERRGYRYLGSRGTRDYTVFRRDSESFWFVSHFGVLRVGQTARDSVPDAATWAELIQEAA